VRAKRSEVLPQTTRTPSTAENNSGPVVTAAGTDSSAGPGAGRAEEDFFWAVVYELRQPLTSLTGQAQLARRFLTTDPLRAGEALDVVMAQVKRIDRVLAELHGRARPTEQHSMPPREIQAS
jgi:nitrogen-specific signal transduction histidine kinase